MKFGIYPKSENILEKFGSILTTYDTPFGEYHSVYILKSFTGKGIYKELVRDRKLRILTLDECDLVTYLLKNEIEHIVLKHSNAYKLVQKFYGDQRAERSKVPYIYHIDEGLAILNSLGSNHNTKEAFALHPILQVDEDFIENKTMDFSPVPAESLILAMEYRRVANSYLSTSHPSQFVGFSCPEIREMLIADKVQNYKDFIRYHASPSKNGAGLHPKSKELFEYFDYWFKLLDIDYSKLVKFID